jgi:hypothetical protein
MDGFTWSHVPKEVTVRCRECGGPAVFEPARTFVPGAAGRELRDDPSVVGVEFGRGFLRNRFPYLFPRRTGPLGHFGHFDGAAGVVTCARCVSRCAHQLAWPSEAYYLLEHRGATLWAWNREYLVMIRDFIASQQRDTAGHYYFRRKLPKEFLLAKRRVELTAKLDRLLAAT